MRRAPAGARRLMSRPDKRLHRAGDTEMIPVSTGISSKTDIDNHTPNRDGIDGDLDDPVIARWIHEALTAS